MTRRLLLFFATSFISIASFAQTTTLWTSVADASVKSFTTSKSDVLPQHASFFKLNALRASQLLRQSLPADNARQITTTTTSEAFDIPLPDGGHISTSLLDAPILSDALQKAYPGIKTYQLINRVNKNVAARLTISSLGISGFIFTDKGTAYISPLGPDFPDVHMIYYVKDIKELNATVCGVKDELLNRSNMRESGIEAGDGKKRTFRLAVAATGEYVTWAGSQANALTYITTTVNDITAIYERDATISFTLVTNNSILFTNASTDPYATTSFPDGTTLSTNQTTLNSNIGSTNYDLGIVFNNGWNGGLAALSVVCNNSAKGQGAAGLNFGIGANPTNGPQGPVFDGTVAHELAHQFSATHTFAANNGSCSGNTTAATAYEPGGGSTLMAYAGTCTGNSYQLNSDLYFHAGSIAQIQTYVTSGSASCSTPVTISNHQPTVTVPAASYIIPISTPFKLTATGSDVDGNTLKYTWEQMDAGAATSSPPQANSTSGPNFRSYPPSLNNYRIFPQILDIVANNSPTYEVLSSVARTLNFRVTARDEAAGGGGTGEANVAVNVNASAGPFIVTSQSSATSWTFNGTNTATINWNVANTTASPLSCSAVDILFSTDGGITYPYTLVANTPNDGTQTIIIPNLSTSIGRIQVRSVNNIFFNINTADITITSSCSAEGTNFSPSTAVTATAGNSALDLNLSPIYGSVVAPSGQLTTANPSSNLALVDSASGGPAVIGNRFRYDTYSFTVNKTGSYTLTASPFATVIDLYTQSFVPANPATNFITSNGIYRSVSNTVGYSSSMTVSLTAGKYYTLAVGTFSASQPTLPANYTVSVSGGPSGGNLYSGPVDPGSSFNYTYVIVDNATGNIKAIDAGSDLSNSSTYPSGTFTVYGLSYSNSISPATLNSYVGGSYSTLYNDLLDNPTICGNLSKNLLVATVNASLPVKLLPLSVKKDGNKALLSWGTASEQNNNYFEIQRSADGLAFTEGIGKVQGVGNSNTTINYNFTDALPLANWNYYRVKQVDLDGTPSFTNIARINFAANASLNTYPSPAKSVLNVEYYAENSGQVSYIVFDSKGGAIKMAVFAAQKGRNLLQLNVSGLASGAYMLKTVSNNQVFTSRFIKE